jgi:hypothetical protein
MFTETNYKKQTSVDNILYVLILRKIQAIFMLNLLSLFYAYFCRKNVHFGLRQRVLNAL